MEYVLDFLQYVSTSYITIPVESITKGQGSRLLLGNITLAQPINDMLIRLESQVIAVS